MLSQVELSQFCLRHLAELSVTFLFFEIDSFR
jgi:hypothetical protein